MIEIQQLTKSLRGGGHLVDIIKRIDLVIPDGQFVALTGASGSGKTTLIGLIAGLDEVSSGKILIDGEDITKMNEDALADLRSQKFGFIFQNFHLIPTLTARENVILAKEISGGETKRTPDELLKDVGLGDRIHHYPSQLSGGEQQRLALARAFINEPKIVLADEPTGNLDSKNSSVILELITTLNKKNGATVILVTHEEVVSKRAERLLVISDGLITQDVMQIADNS